MYRLWAGRDCVLKGLGLSDVKGALLQCVHGVVGVAIFSAVLNVLTLTGSLYMLQIYDRVLPSHSIPTLVGLTIVMIGLYLGYGLLDFIRLRLLGRIANHLDRSLHGQVFNLSLLLPLRTSAEGNRMQPMRDLEQIRAFVSGTGPTAFFDLPWIPFYLLIIFCLHPILGILATVGAIVIVCLTLVAEIFSRGPSRRAAESITARRVFVEASRRNAEVIRAMGLTGRLGAQWSDHSHVFLKDQQRISDVLGATGSLSKTLRMILQSLMLGLGAYLVIEGEASSGVIIASSIMLGRSLAPVDVAIGNWKGLMTARQSYAQLNKLLKAFRQDQRIMALPAPRLSLSVEEVAVGAPGLPKPLIQNVSFKLEAGAGLGVIGPSGSGKTTLARALVGAWNPLRGKIRLDGAALDQWDFDALGRHIGYLPQDIELFDGTVAQNISRFEADADPGRILAAAQAAGLHQIILHLSEGFQTRVGEGGAALSAGQRQLVGVARALYGDPFLVVMDEPNSNLDMDGDVALATAIASVRARGGVAIVVAHRPSVLANLDQLLVMQAGSVQAFGAKEEILAKMTRPAVKPAAENRQAMTVVPLHQDRQ